jgi:glycosyltransferase involved in cell wall biosynthesis
VASGKPIRVLQSFRRVGPQTNPYITQLRDAFENSDAIEPLVFSWRTALLRPFDVFHVHWPEALLERRGWVSTAGRRVLYALFLLRLAVQRIPIVRTVHNTEVPQGLGVTERALLALTERLTRARIVLNEFTPVPPGSLSVQIPHGHYRDWFSRYEAPGSHAGRVLFFGKIRRYKNVEGLVRAFTAIGAESIVRELRVAGSPSGAGLADSIRSLAGGDERIELSFEFLDDRQLVDEIGRAALIVLPYPEMHNSGSVLAALSLARAVLVPENPFNTLLSAEVGEGWVLTYAGQLEAEHIERAMAQVGDRPADAAPDLSRREWTDAGDRHADAFRLAVLGEHAALGRGPVR